MKFQIQQRPNNELFMMAAFALALICTIQSEENQHSARWNRTRGAEDSILRVCDTYVPGGINELKLNKVWQVIDGPVMDSIKKHSGQILAAIEGDDAPSVYRCSCGKFASKSKGCGCGV